MTDLSDHAMQVRALVSAKDAGSIWDLRCEVREKMIAFLRERHPDALPRNRLTMADTEGPRSNPGERPAAVASH